MTNTKTTRLRMLLALAVIPRISCAYAQTAPDPVPGDDIVVTANKRSENLSKVGLSVVAISGDVLRERQITSLEDIAAIVPGLSFSPSANATPILTLRGIGFNESSLGVYPAVSSYVDQVPLPFPVMTTHAAFDLERIEVLKGPQGTLFGQNATGGAINFIAAKPTKTWQSGGDLSYGRFNSVEGNAFVSGPIAPNAGIRLAVNGLRADDWQYSITRKDTNGSKSYLTGRLSLAWEPTSAIRLLFGATGFRDKSDPQAQQMIAFRPSGSSAAVQAAVAANYAQGIQLAPNKPRAADWTAFEVDQSLGVPTADHDTTGAIVPGTAPLVDFSPSGDRKLWLLSTRADIDLSDAVSVTSLTSYGDYHQDLSIDTNGSRYLISDIQSNVGKITTFNQELRVANDRSRVFRWVVGANYENSDTAENILYRYRHTVFTAANKFINASRAETRQSIENYAVFAGGEYNILENLTAKAGARYTRSRIDATSCGSTTPGGNVDIFFNFLGSAFGRGTPFTPIGPSDCYSLNALNVPSKTPYMATLAQHNVSWRAGLDYQMSPKTLFYASVSRAFKAGSFPVLTASNIAGLAPVSQEKLTAYEVGIKTKLADNAVTMNGSVFYYDYRDKQVRGKIPDVVFTVLDALVNVPKSRIYGAEAEVIVRPVDGLTVSGSVTYLNSKITEYTAPNILGTLNFDHSSSPLPFTPKWSGTINVDYRIVRRRGSPFVGVTVSARSSSDAVIAASRIDFLNTTGSFAEPGVGCVFCISGYATADARIGYEEEMGRWKAYLWGKNVFNRYYWTSVQQSYDGAGRFAGMPATYGATVAVKFD